MKKARMASFAALLVVGLFTGVAEANYTITMTGRAKCQAKQWVTVKATLYRYGKLARSKYVHKNRYQWYAFTWTDWQAFKKRNFQGNHPRVQGVWQKKNSKFDITNNWNSGRNGDFVLVCQTSKTNWYGAGYLRVKVGPIAAPRPRPRPKPVRKVTKVVLSPLHSKIKPGQSLIIHAICYDQYSRPIQGVKLSYVAAGGGTMSGNCYQAGRVPGKYQIWVRDPISGVASVADVTIIQPAVLTRIVVTPPKATLRPGGAVRFSACAYDQFGKAMAANLEYVSQAGGHFKGSTFYAGAKPGRVLTWVRHRATNVAQVVEINIIDPRVLTYLTIKNPVKRARCGTQVKLELQGWDQYNRPMAVPSNCSWSCSRRARLWNNTFFAPNQPGQYVVEVVDPKTRVRAKAFLYVFP